jgi:heme exporter protein C
MALRGGVEAEEKRAALAAAYAIFAFVTVPLLIFVAPRVVPSLHPTDSIIDRDLDFAMGGTVGMIFFAFVALFTVLFVWIFSLVSRVQALARAQEERGL